MDNLHEDLYTFLIIARSVLFRIENVSEKRCREIKTHISCYIVFFSRKSCRLWDDVENTVRPDGPQMTIWRMRISCGTFKTTQTHTHTHTTHW